MAPKSNRQPWHYDASRPRPQWSKRLGIVKAMERQAENDRNRATARMERK